MASTRGLGSVSLVVAALVLGLAGRAGCSGFASSDIDFLGRGGGWGLVARQGDVDNIFWNASGLGRSEASGGSAFATYLDYHAGVKGGAVGYLGHGRPSWSWGCFVSYLSSGEMALTSWEDPTGGLGASFSYSDVVGGAAFGVRAIPAVLLGAAVKAARQTMDGVSESTVLGDLSATAALWEGAGGEGYACIVGRNWVLGASETDLGEESGSVEAGLGLKFPTGLTSVGCSMVFDRAGGREARFGVAGLLSEEFEARLGYRRGVGAQSDASYGFAWHRGLTAGFSVSFGRLWMDYAYENADPLGGVHRIGLRSLGSR
ncbi:MAG: hypothetical protein WAW06_03180 [bacterium]